MRRLFLIAALFLWTPAGAQNDDATPRKIEKETFVYAVRDADTLRLDRYALLSPDSRAKPCLMFLFGGGFMTGTRTTGVSAPSSTTTPARGSSSCRSTTGWG